MKIGILTYPSQTYIYSIRRKNIRVDYKELPKEIKKSKSTFIDFMNGSLNEIINFREELNLFGNVEIALKIKSKLILSENMSISPEELIKSPFKFTQTLKDWVASKDVILLVLPNDGYSDLNNDDMKGKKIIVCSSKSMEKYICKTFDNVILYCSRKGVARIDKDNRIRIINELNKHN